MHAWCHGEGIIYIWCTDDKPSHFQLANWATNSTNDENHQKTVKIQQKRKFSTLVEICFQFFSTHFWAFLNCYANALNFG